MGFAHKELMEKAASALEALEAENKSLQEKVASFEKRERCEKIAKKMIEKGLVHDSVSEFIDKVAELLSVDDLNVIDKAVDISVHGLSLGSEDDRDKVAGSKDLDPITALIWATKHNEDN
jgi:hypothetical protein